MNTKNVQGKVASAYRLVPLRFPLVYSFSPDTAQVVSRKKRRGVSTAYGVPREIARVCFSETLKILAALRFMRDFLIIDY